MNSPYENPFKSSPTPESAIHPEQGIFAEFALDLKPILFSPRRFFQSLNERLTVGKALTYGVLAHWFGAATQLILKNIGYGSQSQMDQILEKLLHSQASEWEAIRVAADPLTEIFKILSLSLGIYVASKILINTKTILYRDSIRIVALASVPCIWTGIPYLGDIVANFWSFIVLLAGIQGYYKITSTRSMFVIFFPQLFTSILLVLLVLMLAGAAILPFLQLFIR